MSQSNLRDAIYYTLKRCGTEIMDDPKAFVSVLYDQLGNDYTNRKYLADLFQNGLLKFFNTHKFRNTREIENAAVQAFNNATDKNKLLSRDWVWEVCAAMAYAMESYYGYGVKQMISPDAKHPSDGLNARGKTVDSESYQSNTKEKPEISASNASNNRNIWAIVLAAAAIVAIVTCIVLMVSSSKQPSQPGDSLETGEPLATAYPEESYVASTAETNIQTPTESDSSPMNHIYMTVATSHLPEEYGFDYYPGNIIDNKLDTAWVEGVDGPGVGESITVQLQQKCTVSGFSINAGYQKNTDIYYKNCRPESITVVFSDGSRQSFHLSDTMSSQIITFDNPVETQSVTIVIDAVYAGNKYEDTAISEIMLFS